MAGKGDVVGDQMEYLIRSSKSLSGLKILFSPSEMGIH